MRPHGLDDLVGQAHLRAPGAPLRQLIEGDQPMSLLLWGPPGSGKTTIAAILSRQTNRTFVELSAVSAGVKEVRSVIEAARKELGRARETVLFVDEVHRFSKSQQDALLPGVENRWVTLVAATTENPFFSVISPLLSRSLLLRLEPLSDDDIRTLVHRAVDHPRGLAGSVSLGAGGGGAPDPDVRWRRTPRVDLSRGGCGRRRGDGCDDASTSPTLETAVDRAAVRYDRDGDQHYDVASALIKSIRGSDVDASLHYLARMIEAGEDPRFVARRLVILASEDIGMADPTALGVAVAAHQASQFVGLPEAAINLAHAVIHLALAPKSNAVVKAIGAALDDVRSGRVGSVPAHLRDAHYGAAKKLGHGTSYEYSHTDPRGIVAQQYAPDAVAGRVYYEPTAHGAEKAFTERLARIRRILAGDE